MTNIHYLGIYKQTNKQTDRQTDKQTNKQIITNNCKNTNEGGGRIYASAHKPNNKIRQISKKSTQNWRINYYFELFCKTPEILL